MESNSIPYINAETSALVDKELMGAYKYSIDQLMEIAGLTVAKVVNQEYVIKSNIKNLKIFMKDLDKMSIETLENNNSKNSKEILK